MTEPSSSVIRDFIPIVGVVVGGVLTFLGGVVGGSLARRAQFKAERKSFAGALAGELSALLSIVERRRYLAGLDDVIRQTRESDQSWILQISIRRSPFQIYEANISRLGVLPYPLPRRVAQIYAQAASILEDFEDMRGQEARQWSKTEAIARLEELRNLLHDTIDQARQLAADLENVSGSKYTI